MGKAATEKTDGEKCETHERRGGSGEGKGGWGAIAARRELGRASMLARGRGAEPKGPWGGNGDGGEGRSGRKRAAESAEGEGDFMAMGREERLRVASARRRARTVCPRRQNAFFVSTHDFEIARHVVTSS